VGESGYYRQPDTEDYWVRARVYRPRTGRWLSRDPRFMTDHGRVSIRGRLHAYLYCDDDPVNYVDVTGKGKIGRFFRRLWRGVKNAGRALWEGITRQAPAGGSEVAGGAQPAAGAIVIGGQMRCREMAQRLIEMEGNNQFNSDEYRCLKRRHDRECSKWQKATETVSNW
jgi:RHS repeat-associated protein